VLGDGNSCSNSIAAQKCSTAYSSCYSGARSNRTQLCECMAAYVTCEGTCPLSFNYLSSCLTSYGNLCDCGASAKRQLSTRAIAVNGTTTAINALSLSSTYYSTFIIGTDQGVFHSMAPDSPASWFFTTPQNGPRTFMDFAEVKGQMLSVGADANTGPIAANRPANPSIWVPVKNEPPSNIKLNAIETNYTIGSITGGVQVAVGYTEANGTTYATVLLSTSNGNSFDVVYIDSNPGTFFNALYLVPYCYGTATSGPQWIAAGTSIVFSQDAINWMPAAHEPVPLDANTFATSLGYAYAPTSRNTPVMLGGTNGLIAFTVDCGNTWTVSPIS